MTKNKQRKLDLAMALDEARLAIDKAVANKNIDNLTIAICVWNAETLESSKRWTLSELLSECAEILRE